MPIAELAPAPYNPRKDLKAGDREYESLKRSIEEFGVVDPVIFNRRTKRLIGGHQRLTVLRDLGYTSAPAVLVDLDEPREKALNLALNKITGAWDMPLLKDLLLDIERSGGDQTLTGFDPKEIEEIITSYRDDDPGEDIPVPEPPADPVTRPSDRYELGPHRLLCGDARDGGAWEILICVCVRAGSSQIAGVHMLSLPLRVQRAPRARSTHGARWPKILVPRDPRTTSARVARSGAAARPK